MRAVDGQLFLSLLMEIKLKYNFLMLNRDSSFLQAFIEVVELIFLTKMLKQQSHQSVSNKI